MLKRYMTALLLIVLLSIPSELYAYRLEETWQRSFKVEEGAEFELDNVNGSITIEGWDRDEIDVFAEIRIKAPSKTKAKKLFKKLEFEVDEDPRRVSVSAKRPRIRQDGFFGFMRGENTSINIRYTVKVPDNIHLDIENTNGEIITDDVLGTFDLHTVNGAINIESFRGEGEAHTVNGGIDCTIEDFPEDGELMLKTVNGGIDLKLPEDAGGTLEARTSNGGIDLDFELSRRVRVKRSFVKGEFGHGEGRIYLKTVNGRISIEPL